MIDISQGGVLRAAEHRLKSGKDMGVHKRAVWRRRHSFRRIVAYVFLAAGVIYVVLHLKVASILHYRALLDTDPKNPAKPACVQAQLKMYPNQKYRDFFGDTRKVPCPGKDWVKTEAGKFKILDFAKKQFGDITCDFLPLLRGGDDFHFHNGELIRNIQDGANVTSDVARISCSAGAARYDNVHVTVPYVESLHRRNSAVKLPKEALGLSVLIFGLDSVSRMTWQRKLPKSYAYMMDVLKVIVLEGYNVAGDGTPAAVQPWFTGKQEWELPEARRGHKGAQTLNGHPWIWDDFKKAGYVTHYTEDLAEYGTFTLRMLGFKEQPTDHYLRHFYQVLEKERIRRCLGSEFKHKVLMNYLKDFESMYKNRRSFSFGFHNELSHDSNKPLNIVDDELKEWLEALYNGGSLNNTMFLLLSDHGARYQYLRETVQGKMEERNPFFSIRMPPWFQTKYPAAYKNLLTNSKRLVAPYDIHETFHDILHFRNEARGNISKRGISLFSEIPAERTCAHAGIQPHWCNCLDWTTVNTDSVEVKKAIASFIDFVNSLTAHVRDVCSIVEVDRVLGAQVLTPNTRMLQYKSMDYEGVENFSMKQDVDTKLYQLVIHTKPGGGHYEATATQDVQRGTFISKLKDISRTNAYGTSSVCVAKTFPHLVKFCHCKST
ncbi:uncharacterized protein LOC135494701 [Lineus longissimus]|uniref:uncharacterized protein LOC135494701 n=1 Tax=Lineus longissimus TaxID=88925 RepID=UPI002B4D45D4